MLPAHLTGLSTMAYYALKKDTSTIRGAAKAYRESQTRIYKIEAPMYVGVGEGIDSLDFHADLSALKVILPDESHERPLSSQPVPRSDSPLLHQQKNKGRLHMRIAHGAQQHCQQDTSWKSTTTLHTM